MFLDTGKADELRDAYDAKLFEFAKKTGIDMSKAAANSSQQLQDQAKPRSEQSKPQWKHTDDEYNAWKKSKGVK
jgi:hypothetical protein